MPIQRHSPAILTIIQEAELVSGPVCIGSENLTPQGFESRILQPVLSATTTTLSQSVGNNLLSREEAEVNKICSVINFLQNLHPVVLWALLLYRLKLFRFARSHPFA